MARESTLSRVNTIILIVLALGSVVWAGGQYTQEVKQLRNDVDAQKIKIAQHDSIGFKLDGNTRDLDTVKARLSEVLRALNKKGVVREW